MKKKTWKKWLIGMLGVMVILVGACAIYVSDYYHADMTAIQDYEPETGTYKEEKMDDGTWIFRPDTAEAGFIFYPGGKVEHTAYNPLMRACAAEGILCVLVEMPFNLAVLDINAADGVMGEYPEIEKWYIGGHSLGGSMAASYLGDHTDEYEGLILLGSYSTVDISDTDLEVLSIYGSEDQVLNRDKYEENKKNLPQTVEEVIIDGGCHAYFGMYGEQDGDGKAAISNEEQIAITSGQIAEFTE